MGIKEMSNLFEVLFDNITSGQAPGFNEWEKSVLLTKAQVEKLKNYFNPKSNPKQEGFDDSPKRQIDFSSITVKKEYKKVSKIGVFPNTSGEDQDIFSGNTIDPRSCVFEFPDDCFFIINETLTYWAYKAQDTKDTLVNLQVIPIKNTEYTRLMSKPYKAPLKGQAWRLIDHIDTVGEGEEAVDVNKTRVEIILTPSNDKQLLSNLQFNGVNDGEARDNYYLDGRYTIRYIREPKPIILEDFAAEGYPELKIHGASAPIDIANDIVCELDPAIHEEIVQRAVELAKIAWQGDVKTVVEAGQRSE